MESIFSKDNAPEPPSRYAKVWIESEIKHLKKKRSTRTLTQVSYNAGRIFLLLLIFGILFLYILDPVFYSFYKGDAIQAYLYLHNYGGDEVAQEMAQTSILSAIEVGKLNQNHGKFLHYFESESAARREANIIIHYMETCRDLRAGHYDKLDPLQKIRYFLFIKTGFTPPLYWTFVNPTVPDPA